VGIGGALVYADDSPSPAPSKKAADTKKLRAGLGTASDADLVRAINEDLAEKWKDNQIVPSERASDYQFLRRASLDIIGRIAKPDEIKTFLRDPDSSRRALLIERLLKSEEYAKNWANIWTVWLLTRSGANDPTRAIYHDQMRLWLEEQFAKPGMSYKELVIELLTATGKTNENGAVNYILAHLGEPVPKDRQEGEDGEGRFNMVPVTSRTTRLFLGVQTQCAQCHPHPFNKELRQEDFWGVNAFFRQVERDGDMAMRRQMRPTHMTLRDNPKLNPSGRIFFEQRNSVVRPTKGFLLKGGPKLTSPEANRRQELAQYVTGHKNFGKAYVNRMWAHFFGRGFTNPIDDFGPENEPSHPELLDQLAAEFEHYGYDPRRLIRWICNSDAYNQSSVANKSNDKSDAERFFSRMLLKSMGPEQLFESLMAATQPDLPDSKNPANQAAIKAIKDQRKKLRDDWIRALTSNFGDDEGNEVTFNGTIVQALMMINGSDINNAVTDLKAGTIAAVAARKGNPRAIMDQLYLAALNRPPTAKEANKIMDIRLHAPVSHRDDLAFYQDLFWALLNSNEFMLNH
jgi:hypothetical protein